MDSKPIENLVGFITAEAREKSIEIEQEAQELYSIDRHSLVEAGRKKIKAEYERKEKQCTIAKKITQSNLAKDQRLRVLKERDVQMHEMQEMAREKLVALTKSPQYATVLVNLITQCITELEAGNAPLEIHVVARDKSLIEQCIKQVKVKNAMTVASTSLDDEEIGGCIVSMEQGKIKSLNTFKMRAASIMQDMLPRFRELLFP